ncbi:MAG: hypothetical protein AAF456_20360 [Planctomycetota bacterium]
MANYPPGQPPQPPFQQPGHNPYQPGAYNRPPNPPRNVPRKTPGKLLAPAITLIVFGVFDFLYGILNLISNMTGPKEIPPQLAGDPFWEQMYANMNDPESQVMGVVLSIVMMLVATILIAGAAMMVRRRVWGFAMAAAVVAIIPCTGVMDCCLLAEVAVGIWAMVVLFDPNIKAMFN